MKFNHANTQSLQPGDFPRHLVKALSCLILLAGLVLGCTTSHGHLSAARSGLSFVDFHSDPPEDLAWRVSRFDFEKRTWVPVYADLKPPAGGVLRLACVPGPYQFQVTLLNRVVLQPALVDVEVVEGLTTPVRVGLIPNDTQSADQPPAVSLDIAVQSPVTYHPLP